MTKKKATKKAAPVKAAKATKTTTAKAPAAKASKAKAKHAGEMLIVGSKTKEAIRTLGCNVSSDTLEAINSYVHWLVGQAVKRASANGRKTVRGHDFILSEH